MDVTLLTAENLIWPMGQQDSVPQYQCGCGSYPRVTKVDPYPCYAPDLALTTDLVNECESVFPLVGDVCAYYVLSHEVIDRFNGCTFQDSIYYDKDGRDNTRKITCYCGCKKEYDIRQQAYFVVLSGKRIPLHPAMLRYLVAHEYGHMAFYHLARRMGYRDSDEKHLYDKYMAIRGVSKDYYAAVYSGSKWHRHPGEIFANDFRTLIMGKEREFWPHDSAEVPMLSLNTPKVLDWWKEAFELCSLSFNPVL